MQEILSKLSVQEFTNGVRLTVQVKAQSRETKLIIEADGTIVLHVDAPPTNVIS